MPVRTWNTEHQMDHILGPLLQTIGPAHHTIQSKRLGARERLWFTARGSRFKDSHFFTDPAG